MIFCNSNKTKSTIKDKTIKAMSLLEVLLYVSILSLILIAIVSFFGTLLELKTTGNTVSEVDQNAAQILEMMTTTIRGSTSVTSPANGATAAALSLSVPVGANSPTVFDLSGGAIRIKEGAAAAINLSTSQVTASGLSFTNLTGVASKQTIKFEFTLTYNNPDGRKALTYSKTYYGSATIR